MQTETDQKGLDATDPGQNRALARYAAVCWVSDRLSNERRNGWTVQSVTAEAATRSWDGWRFSAGSIERYLYTYRKEGFAGLLPERRNDKGTCRTFTPEQQQLLLEMRTAHPDLDATVLVQRLVQQEKLLAGTFSMSSVYRLFASHCLDRRSLKAGRLEPGSGPQKAFELPVANMLWMADMMYGPTVVTPSGKALRTRLFALIDDHSRLCPYGEYFASEKGECFMRVLHQAVRARGVPEKLYTDNGKVFLSRHLRIVCANLGTKLSHARPYAAWSKGKVERFFRTVQSQFQQSLVLDPVHSLETINARFHAWLSDTYHARKHRATGESPAERFKHCAGAIRCAPPDDELERLFMMREVRRVRKDATLGLNGMRFEVSPALRGQQVEIRYTPGVLLHVEVWHQDHFVQTARPLNLSANARHRSS